MVPKEGATGWADTTMLHADAKHPNCAYMWMEHSLDPKVQGDLAAWFGSVPSVPDGLQGQRAAGRRRLQDERLREVRARSPFWRTPIAKCTSQENCVPYSRWVTDYIAVMGGRYLLPSFSQGEKVARAAG